MEKFQLVLVRPQGYLHSEAFRELAETLQLGLTSLGHTAQIQENSFAPGVTNIFLGAHLLSPQQASLVPPGSVIYNLEQLNGAHLAPTYYELASHHQVWDYSLENIEKWTAMNCGFTPVHVPIGYVPEMTRILATQIQDIDVLFYGSLNERRIRILNALRDAGAKVRAQFGVYGKERDELIARSKIILNIHFYSTKVFEIVRVSYLLANSKAVVTESSPLIEDGLADSVRSLAYDSLVEGCLSLLRDEKERRRLEERGFQWFSKRSESEILANALRQCAATPIMPADCISIPRKLNLGSGKDWRPDYFNADCNPYWEPDAVLDFNCPLPIGQPLQTLRFGTIRLQNNFFEEIVANDALEHIPNLATAMTSCLHLLKVGGLFRISVPYDLSWGAWQDPTHVRAFNERSWLYYTDWFWYMGWREARFDLVQFDLGLSPIGENLKKQRVKGEDLVRHPRAVDQLRVTLRKRLLTEAEKQQVDRHLMPPTRRASAASPQCVLGRLAYDVHWKEIPIFITNRNRLDCGFRKLVTWLQNVGQEKITVLDNGSTYPPLLEYYDKLSGVTIIRQDNQGPWAFWRHNKLHLQQETPYIVSDADVSPDNGCPEDLLERLLFVLTRHRDIVLKVGPGLRVDNLPDAYAKKGEVIKHETQFSLEAHRENHQKSSWVVDGTPEMFDAFIDTTFALYHPKSEFPAWHHHYRLDKPYVFEHRP